MKISLEKKIVFGFIMNLCVVFAIAWIFILRIDKQRNQDLDLRLNWIIISLILFSVLLLTIVYFIIRSQLRAKNISQNLVMENKLLFQAIIDNTSLPMFIKKLNGEYLLVNKQFGSLFKISLEEIIGKTDHDFLAKPIADNFRNSDFEAVKTLKELKTEETIELSDGIHTYIAVRFPIYDSFNRIYAIGGIFTDISERKKSEETLKAGDKFFNMSLDIMLIASKDKFLKINPTISKILGYSEEELLHHPFFTYIHPEDLDITHKEIDKLQTGVLTIEFENRWISKDGSIKWIEWSASPDLSTGFLYAVGRDITAQKEIEKSLKIVNNFFEMSFDAFFVAKGTTIIKINPAFTKISGYVQSDLAAISLLDLIHPDYVKIATERLTKRLEGIDVDTNVIYPVRCKDGTYKWAESMIATDVETGTIYAVLQDITQKKMDEEKLNVYTQKLIDDEQQIQTIFDGAPDPVIVIDSESNVLKWNPKAEAVFGWKTDEIIGKPLYEFIVPIQYRELHKKGMELFLATGSGAIINKTTEMVAINKEGTEFPVSLSISPVKMGDKYIFIGFVRDVTENKKIINNLYENEEKLRLIVENISEGIIVANADKKIILANKMGNEIFGIEQDDKISTNLSNHFQLYYPDEKTIFPSQNLPMERALNGEVTDDIEIVLWNPVEQKKKRVLISGKPLMDQNKNVVAAVVTIKDISKYKQMEEDLKETESKYRQLIGFRKGSSDTMI
ncbi:PAS domain S-box protein [Flavobacterium sp. LB2R40]|uniref:PAS domain S-box protein n=1 Tax=unclassified Flavobacterium TaxID=196869 RepID=UPI003AAB2B5B